MGRNKRWDGYTSWSYLKPGFDFDVYPLEKQVDRVPRYDFGLSKAQEERVEEVLEKNLIISLHDHIDVREEGYPLTRLPFPPKRIFKAYEGLAHSGMDAVIDNVAGGAPTFESVIAFLGLSLCDYAHQDFVIPALRVEDVTRAPKERRVAVIHAIEQATCLERDVDRIDSLFGLGLRAMGLMHRESNLLGSSQDERVDGGLTEFGYDAIKRMNKTGIIVDISHAGDRTSLEAIEASDKPILISHTGSRTLSNIYRMHPDEVLQACAEKGGLVGVEVAGFAPRTKKHPEASIEGLLEHLEYLMELLGVDHVGAGPDSGFSDHATMYRNAPRGEWKPRRRASGHYVRPRPAEGPPMVNWGEMVKDLDYVKGLESPSEFSNIARGLVRDGYSDEEIAKVMGLNGLRIINACWPR